MTVVSKVPNSIWRNMAGVSIWQLCIGVLLTLVACLLEGNGFINSLGRVVASDLPIRFAVYLVISTPILGWMVLHFERRERRWKWDIQSGRVDIYNDNDLVRSLRTADIVRFLSRSTSIGVFTRDPSDYFAIKNLPKGEGVLAKQKYEG